MVKRYSIRTKASTTLIVLLGTTYYYDKNWTFRSGIAFDDSPVPADKRSISIPDQDRFWISAGATYAFNENASDAGVSYMHGQKVTFQEGSTSLPLKVKPGCSGTNFNYVGLIAQELKKVSIAHLFYLLRIDIF